MSLPDTIFIFGLALVIFGPKKLPEIGRQMGKLLYEFRRASNEFKLQIEEELRAAEQADRQRIASSAAVTPAVTSLEPEQGLAAKPPGTGIHVSTDPPNKSYSYAGDTQEAPIGGWESDSPDAAEEDWSEYGGEAQREAESSQHQTLSDDGAWRETDSQAAGADDGALAELPAAQGWEERAWVDRSSPALEAQERIPHIQEEFHASPLVEQEPEPQQRESPKDSSQGDSDSKSPDLNGLEQPREPAANHHG